MRHLTDFFAQLYEEGVLHTLSARHNVSHSPLVDDGVDEYTVISDQSAPLVTGH